MAARRKRVQVANPADGGFFYWLAKFYLLGVITLGMAGVCAVPAVYLGVAAATAPPPNLDQYANKTELATRILASDGRILTTLVDRHRSLVTIDQVPQRLINAFLAAEDRAFFQHRGVDFRGITRAALANLRAGRVRQGGSTITQQVAKAYLTPERTIQRKLKEIVLARRIEERFSKHEILYLYLNHIYLGANAYGVKAAARVYFGKRLDQLTLAEMALLAGLVRAPSRYSARAHPARALRRRNQVLRAMTDAGFITAKAERAARGEALRVARQQQDPLRWYAPHFTEHVRRELVQRYGKQRVYTAGWTVDTTADLWLTSLAQRKAHDAVNALDKRQGWRGPVARLRSAGERQDFLKRVRRIYGAELDHIKLDRPYPMLVTKVTSRRVVGAIGHRTAAVPLALMRWAAAYSRTNSENERTVDSARKVVRVGDVVWVTSPPRWLRRKTWGDPAAPEIKMALHQIPRVEGALYSYDHQTGYVMAMVGGLDFDRSTFNRAVQACRQPGSTYKPVYYSLALDSPKFSMATILHDNPYQPEPGEEWNPQNVHGTLDGRVTMHMSLVRSLNLPSIKLLVKVGAAQAAAWARRLGFTTPIHADKALALGASCVRTDELTRAFATFARGGTQRDPVAIRRIRDRAGALVADYTVAQDALINEGDRLDRIWATSAEAPRQVISARTAFLISKLLRDSVLMGIAGRCRIVPVPTAGKGGTSSDTMDTWFVGFTSRWATTSWIGDDNYQRPLGEKEASYTSAIPLWANYMKAAVRTRPHRELPLARPPGLHSKTVDYITGKPPGPETSKTVTIYYLPGSYREPTDED